MGDVPGTRRVGELDNSGGPLRGALVSDADPLRRASLSDREPAAAGVLSGLIERALHLELVDKESSP